MIVGRRDCDFVRKSASLRVKSPQKSGLAGAAPHGRRGQAWPYDTAVLFVRIPFEDGIMFSDTFYSIAGFRVRACRVAVMSRPVRLVSRIDHMPEWGPVSRRSVVSTVLTCDCVCLSLLSPVLRLWFVGFVRSAVRSMNRDSVKAQARGNRRV